MEDIDLEITNYSNPDIEYFFRLNEIPNYTSDDVTQQVYAVRTELMGDQNFPKELKHKFIEFIQLATERLWEGGTIKKSEQLIPLIQETTMDYPEQLITTRKSEIVKHPTAQYIYSDPSNVHKGDLNPLNNRILTRSLTIDTKLRENWSFTKSNDFTVNLPTKLSKVVSMQLTSIEFPVNFYGISQVYGNNHFTIVITDDSSSPITYTEIFTIPDGNYTSSELSLKINSLLLDTPTNTLSSTLFYEINLTHDSNTGHVTVKVEPPIFKPPNSANIATFTLHFNQNSDGGECTTSHSITQRLGYVLGFTKDSYTGALTYTSEGLINPFPINYIYLAIEDFNQNVANGFISASSDTVTSSDIIARITVNNNYFTVINGTNQNIVTEPREYFGPVDITRLRIRVYDEYGRLLDMNNSDFSCCLTMKQVYNL
jgi:hypothetical protein